MKKVVSIFLTGILIFAFAIFALGSGSSEKVSVEKNTAEQSASEPVQSDSNQRVEIHKGETLNANGLKITYDSAEEWVSNNQFIQPGDGKHYIRLHFTAENEANADRFISVFEFDCYADGEKCQALYAGDEEISSNSISSGRKVSGYVYFEVPVNASEIEVEYETSFWTDKKAFFIVEL